MHFNTTYQVLCYDRYQQERTTPTLILLGWSSLVESSQHHIPQRDVEGGLAVGSTHYRDIHNRLIGLLVSCEGISGSVLNSFELAYFSRVRSKLEMLPQYGTHILTARWRMCNGE